MASQSNLSFFGIRHHGPGSSRGLVQALTALQPDVVLIEGPPDADTVIPLAQAGGMKPPVALMIYSPEQPQLGAFYPFTEFSPEWRALRFALQAEIPVRFMDLAQTHQLALREAPDAASSSLPLPEPVEGNGSDEHAALPSASSGSDDEDGPLPSPSTSSGDDPRHDPLGYLGRLAGYDDGEEWWEDVVEKRRDGADLFAAIADAMTVLREEQPAPDDVREARREASMRKIIRAAQKEGFQRIAVVCGAWHVPALQNMPPIKEDNTVLKQLPKIKVQATWVPWTYNKLTYASGYGAGLEAPGWYEHLWRHGGHPPMHIINRWLVRVARVLRKHDYDVSTAHVIETLRLTESLAALRDKPLPGLAEIHQAIRSTMLFGEARPLELIEQDLLIGKRIGAVPADTPTVPLQRDLERQQKSLRLKPSTEIKTLDLDLRKPLDLSRSHCLHRLALLGIAWGELRDSGKRKKGTFHELWQLQWQPEFALAVVDASIWGNTVEQAASTLLVHRAGQTQALEDLAQLIDLSLLADLPATTPALVQRLEADAARSNDVGQMMKALPPLVNVLRYGTVRALDAGMVRRLVDSLTTRVCIGLPGACASLDDDAAQTMQNNIQHVHGALNLLLAEEDFQAHWQDWLRALELLADNPALHGAIQGYAARVLLDSGRGEAVATRMSLALSPGNEPTKAAAWLEGFLTGSGMVLLHDETLWGLLDDWVCGLSEDHFTAVLPLVRRSFAAFSTPERRQLGSKAKAGRQVQGGAPMAAEDIDLARAEQVLPVLRTILGLSGHG